MRLLLLILLLLPAFAGADEPVVTDTGDPAPRCLDEWGAFVAGRPSFLQPMSVAASPDGHVFVLDWVHGNILRFALDGTFVDSWKVPSPFHRPAARSLNAIAVSERMVYVSDVAGECIHQFTVHGKHKGTFPFVADVNGLAVDPLDNLYVSGSRVLGLDTLIAPPWGSEGPPDTLLHGTTVEGPALWKLNRLGEVMNRWDRRVGALAADGKGTLLAVTEVYPKGPVSILRLDPTGGRISEWDLGRQLGQGAYRSINALAVDTRGHVFLTSAQLRKIIELNEAGNWTRAWSGAGPERRPILQPVGAAVDTSGCLYVTDWAVSRVVKYDPRKAP
jgi:sugar lactone lactonase YvrE